MTIIEQPSRVDGIEHPQWCHEGWCDASDNGHVSPPQLVTLSHNIELMQNGYRQNRSIGVHLRERHGSADPLVDLSVGGGGGTEATVLTPDEAREVAGLLLATATDAEAGR